MTEEGSADCKLAALEDVTVDIMVVDGVGE